MAKLVILTLEVQEARALLAAAEKRDKAQDQIQYRHVVQDAVNKLQKAVNRASLNERTTA